jgi:hypothetical protein
MTEEENRVTRKPSRKRKSRALFPYRGERTILIWAFTVRLLLIGRWGLGHGIFSTSWGYSISKGKCMGNNK